MPKEQSREQTSTDKVKVLKTEKKGWLRNKLEKWGLAKSVESNEARESEAMPDGPAAAREGAEMIQAIKHEGELAAETLDEEAGRTLVDLQAIADKQGLRLDADQEARAAQKESALKTKVESATAKFKSEEDELDKQIREFFERKDPDDPAAFFEQRVKSLETAINTNFDKKAEELKDEIAALPIALQEEMIGKTDPADQLVTRQKFVSKEKQLQSRIEQLGEQKKVLEKSLLNTKLILTKIAKGETQDAIAYLQEEIRGIGKDEAFSPERKQVNLLTSIIKRLQEVQAKQSTKEAKNISHIKALDAALEAPENIVHEVFDLQKEFNAELDVGDVPELEGRSPDTITLNELTALRGAAAEAAIVAREAKNDPAAERAALRKLNSLELLIDLKKKIRTKSDKLTTIDDRMAA